MQLEEKMRFSWDQEATLTVAERKANLTILSMRDKVALEGIDNMLIQSFFENKEKVEASQLYKALDAMPKGANHHVHTTAANPIASYVELTYEDCVYYNRRASLFKVYPKQTGIEDGYVQCAQLRAFYDAPATYDEMVRTEILLTAPEAEDKDSHAIWGPF